MERWVLQYVGITLKNTDEKKKVFNYLKQEENRMLCATIQSYMRRFLIITETHKSNERGNRTIDVTDLNVQTHILTTANGPLIRDRIMYSASIFMWESTYYICQIWCWKAAVLSKENLKTIEQQNSEELCAVRNVAQAQTANSVKSNMNCGIKAACVRKALQ